MERLITCISNAINARRLVSRYTISGPSQIQGIEGSERKRYGVSCSDMNDVA
jgi:hypothetical protein